MDFFRGRNPELVKRLNGLLDEDVVALAATVRLELLSGARAVDLRRLRTALSGLPVFYPSRDTWQLCERWIEKAVSIGERFGVGDLSIAATAAERGGAVWSLDRDFARFARLRWVKAYRA